MPSLDKVILCEERGETSILIDAEITADGTIQLSGQDLGTAPQDFTAGYEASAGVKGSGKSRPRFCGDYLKTRYLSRVQSTVNPSRQLIFFPSSNSRPA